MKLPNRPAAMQRGGASLLIVLLMLFTMMLTAAYANRGMLFEQKASADQYRATQAAEAADAALDWALSQLNGGLVDANCQPSSSSGDSTFRDRTLLPADPVAGSFAMPADPTRIGLPACARNADGNWHCTCAAVGQQRPALDDSAGAPTPAFTVTLQGASIAASPATPYPGLIQILAQGCAQIDASAVCQASTAVDAAFAAAKVQAALVPALATMPAATLTATGSVDTGSDPVGLHDTDARGTGLVVIAGGAATLVNARIDAPPGSPSGVAVADNDSALAARTPDRLLLTYLGMSEASFQQLPVTVHLHCTNDCTAALRSLLASGRRVVWVDSDITLSDGDLGSPAAPVLLVADGTIHLSGAVRFTGFAFGHGLQWSGGASGTAWLHGAAVSAGDATLAGSPDLIFDASVLNTLHALTGTYVRVPGSWKDSS